MEVIFTLGNGLCNSKICCFQVSFVNLYRSNQMAAIVLQTILSFYTKLQKKYSFFPAITYEKYIVCTDYCNAHHGNKTCFLPACKNHFILPGNVQELLKKLDTFLFHLSTPGLSVRIVQVSIQRKSYCKEWTSVRERATSS